MSADDESAEEGGGGVDPALDPEILEELEFWTGPDDDDQPSLGPSGHKPESGDPPVDDRQSGSGSESGSGGAVVVVGTPIGNLGDLSPRAVEVLGSADVVYCEDTRHSRKLLTHAGISGVRLRSLHEHNEGDRMAEVLGAVHRGATVAIVSDAGMPGISDPGSRVVAAAAKEGLTVTVVPGPSAAIAALVASGLPTDRFCFEGFLPRSGRDRRERLASLAEETRTMVLFEAPSRVPGTLGDLVAVCGEIRQVTVARELTKVHEEIWRGSLVQALSWAEEHPLRGEVVIVLAGAPASDVTSVSDAVLTTALAERLRHGERVRGVVDGVAADFGVPRRRVYDLALEVRRADQTASTESTAPGEATGPEE
jgi:16S rRNA (cytidine1402-2'-O)-methyltransferase